MRSGRSRRIRERRWRTSIARISTFRIRGCTARRTSCELLTSTGLTFEHEIPVAIETPRPSARFLGVFALIGVYVGVIPVAIGLLWYPLMQPHRTPRSAVSDGADDRACWPICSSMRPTTVSKRRRSSRARCRGRRSSSSARSRAYLTLDLIGAWLARRRRETRARPRTPAAGFSPC